MRCLRRDVIPVAGTVAGFFAVQRQYEFALGDDAYVFSIVTVRRDDGASGYEANKTSQFLASSLNASKAPRTAEGHEAVSK